MSPYLLVDDATEASQESKPEVEAQIDDKSEANTTEGTTNNKTDDTKVEAADKETDTNAGTSDEEAEPKKKVDAAEPMKAELKHLDHKYSEKHKWYFAETVEDKAVPDQVDW
jgi:hypothetical protein